MFVSSSMSSSMSSFFNCPITLDIMHDPVKAPDGHTYERHAIEEAIRRQGISPLTRQPMTIDQLIPDYTLKSQIDSISTVATVEVAKAVISASVTSAGTLTELTLRTPDGEAEPKDVVFVIDTSGSMQTEVISSTGESDGYSILDVVKHGILTCIMGLRECDKACIVTYSTTSQVVFPLRKMDTGGQGLAKVALAGIHPENSTNIWSGLKLGIEQLPNGGTIFLLTDGHSNIKPPRGEVAMLTAELDGRDDIVLNTYGFGYNLDSKLLFELARPTQGSYAFIPDIGLVGTVFIHAIANLRTSVSTNLKVAIETTGLIDMPDIIQTSWGYFLPIGQITKGQDRTIFINCDKPVKLSILDIDIVQRDQAMDNLDHQIAAVGILKCHQLASQSRQTESRQHLALLLSRVTKPSILEDLNGQVREGIEAYRKWGKHYMPSLALAYLTQQCNNFMDKGIQKYGGATFQEIRNSLDTMFNKLPAPTPTHRLRIEQQFRAMGTAPTAAPLRMNTYNNSAGPCFAGTCRVLMADNDVKECQQIVKGDIVSTSLGGAKVVCVVKTICKDQTIKLVQRGTLLVTPWHPIKVNGQWDFPINQNKACDTACTAVYSFLLEPGFQDMKIEDVECITLAHGIVDDKVASHAFYGTTQVIDNLKESATFEKGCVELEGGNCLTIDVETSLVCGLRFIK